jgi:hypothetical protein
MFKIDYFIFQYFLTSKIAVLYKKNANGSPLLNRILFFPKNKLFSVMSHMALIYMTSRPESWFLLGPKLIPMISFDLKHFYVIK